MNRTSAFLPVLSSIDAELSSIAARAAARFQPVRAHVEPRCPTPAPPNSPVPPCASPEPAQGPPPLPDSPEPLVAPLPRWVPENPWEACAIPDSDPERFAPDHDFDAPLDTYDPELFRMGEKRPRADMEPMRVVSAEHGLEKRMRMAYQQGAVVDLTESAPFSV